MRPQFIQINGPDFGMSTMVTQEPGDAGILSKEIKSCGNSTGQAAAVEGKRR